MTQNDVVAPPASEALQERPARSAWRRPGDLIGRLRTGLRAAPVSALGKLVQTTAFKLTLVYLTVFSLFAAFLLGYLAWNTRRLVTEQITRSVDAEFTGLALVVWIEPPLGRAIAATAAR